MKIEMDEGSRDKNAILITLETVEREKEYKLIMFINFVV